MKKLTKRDALLILFVFLGLAALLLIWRAVYSRPGNYCEITVSGRLYATCPLSAEQKIPIKNAAGEITNTLLVSGGKAKMLDAACPDHLCMHQKAIERDGETIVCLPNYVIVEIIGNGEEGEEDESVDAIVK